MKALILAAGYATRLGELTKDRPKPLLPVGGRPIVDSLLEKLREVPTIDEVVLVTNHRFAAHFGAWAEQHPDPRPLILDDGTISDEDKRGAVGDILFAIEQTHLDDDLLVIAGDNLFLDSLVPFVDFFLQHGSSVALYDLGSLEKITRYSAVELDETSRVVNFVEKPAQPRTTLMAIAVYAYQREHLPLVRRYREAGGNMDAPGFFPGWLYRQVPLYGFRITGPWIDIGNPFEYARAQREFPA